MNSCPEGCAECCGLIPFSRPLLERFKDKMVRLPLEYIAFDDLLIPATEDLRCIFLTKENRCNIYPNRPYICRVWGSSQPCLIQDPDNKVAREVERQVEYLLNQKGYRRTRGS